MSLFLIELVPVTATRVGITAALDGLAAALGTSGEIVESQVTAGADRAFVIVDSTDAQTLEQLVGAGLAETARITPPAAVRLVGAELDALKAARPAASHLVEWDLPAGLTMDAYLARKAAKSPRYAQVPQVSFLRTYVREDLASCLCFYDAPDVASVVHAREVVEAPVDRLHTLDDARVRVTR